MSSESDSIERQAKTFGDLTAAALEDANSKIDAVLADADTAIANSKERIAALEKSGEELLHKLSVASMANGYEEDYKNEIRTTYVLRLLVVAGVGVAIYLSFEALGASTETDTFDWRLFLARSSISALFLGLASYVASQAGVHRDAALQARDRQRRLQTFVPYLAPLSPETQDNLRAAMAIHFFGETRSETESSTETDLVGSVVQGAVRGADAVRNGN